MKMERKPLPQVRTELFIDGKWDDGSKERKAVINPATGEEIAQVAQGDKADTERAIAAAKRAFPVWSGMELAERVEILHKIADLMEEKANHLALIMTIEQGKPLTESKAEIKTNVDNMRWNAEESRRIYGELIPASNQHKFEVRKQPVGVVGAITPWNFPSNMIIRKISPAISAGCTVVLKPAGSTPLSAIALFEIFEEAGLPAGVANLVMGSASEIGEAMTESKDVRKLTFTGSTAVGQELYQQSGATLKKISLELGGHAPFIVFKDVPIEKTVADLVKMKLRNNGQACTAPNRIFVEAPIKEEFTQKLVEAVKEVKVGNGQDDVTAGPLIEESARESIEAQLKDAVEKGAEILVGGNRLEEGEYADGFFFEPTVIDGVTKEMDIFYEETFGPVIPLISFDGEDEVIEMANDTDFGLASYLYTTDLRRAEKVSNALEYGLVGLNNTGVSQSPTPFGGIKFSGLGRENGRQGIEEFLELKFVHTAYFQE